MKTCCYPVVWIHDFKDVYMHVLPWNSFVCRGSNHLRYIYFFKMIHSVPVIANKLIDYLILLK